MNEPDQPDQLSLLCARCGIELKPGTGNFYVVRIEALADPTPPSFSEEDMKLNPRAEIERLIEQMRKSSEQDCSTKSIGGSSSICVGRAIANGLRSR